MKPIKATLRTLLLIMPALALAAPAAAQVRPTTLSDSQEPGSVIVFPKFIKGTVTVAPEGVPAPASELKIGIVCPAGQTCSQDQSVTIRFHWVCGARPDPTQGFICQETNFEVTATVFEKVVLVPDGSFPGVSTKNVAGAPCPRGYLIGWVVRPSDGQPVKFDGLIGDATLREGPLAQASYPAIPIQADPALASGNPVTTNGDGSLIFDGAAGHYQAVTGRVFGDVIYSNPTPTAANPFITRGFLTLLTLDVLSNRPNNPVAVDLDFFGGFGSAFGNENQLSTSTFFFCWAEIPLDAQAPGDGGINPSLNTSVMGRDGVFESVAAEKVGIFGITDTTGPVTLLGLSESLEGSPAAIPGSAFRESIYPLSNDSVPVPTQFRPSP